MVIKKKVIIIPLNVSLEHPCDYINQTAKVLKKNFLVVLYEFYNQISWKSLLKTKKINTFLKKVKEIKLKDKGVIILQAPAIFPFQRFKIINKINQFFAYLILSLIILFAKKKVVLWQFFPLIKSFFIKKFFKQTFIYDCVDYLDEKIHGKKIVDNERIIIKKSDYVAFNSLPLAKAKGKNLNNKKYILAYCGCDFDRFNIPFIAKKEKIAIFYGVFDYRISVVLLKRTILNNPHWQFLLIGPIEKKDHPPEKDFFSLLKIKNVVYLGKKPKNKLPNYLKEAKIGLIPYDTRYNFVKYSNPMKAYEYLAAGIPVLSTEILALKQYPKEIIYTTDNHEVFSKALDFLTKNWKEKKALKAKEIAKMNSWDSKIEKILKETKL